jgi:ABC-type uncharacterized transport system permease subunit
MEVFLIGAIAATLRIATPLIFGTLGELFSERAGILNLGIEGTMFLGCFVGFVVGDKSGNLWLGVLIIWNAGRSADGTAVCSIGFKSACIGTWNNPAIDWFGLVCICADLWGCDFKSNDHALSESFAFWRGPIPWSDI